MKIITMQSLSNLTEIRLGVSKIKHAGGADSHDSCNKPWGWALCAKKRHWRR